MVEDMVNVSSMFGSQEIDSCYVAGKRPTIHVCHIIVADDMFAL